MSVESEITGFEKEKPPVSVDIELRGALVARAGARRGRVTVPRGSTVAEAVVSWADEYGNHLQFALLEGERLRSDILAMRISDGKNERLAASQPVANGDTVRFELRD